MTTSDSKPRVDRVTTGTGDGGETSLADGHRYSKSHPRVELIGSLDELNCALGNARIHLGKEHAIQIHAIQSRIFDFGAAVATGKPQNFWAREASTLTQWTETLNSQLEPLREFVLPGGNEVNALLHVARAQTRRCERVFWSLQDGSLIDAAMAPYLNRLSDFLFVLARIECRDEVLWEPLSG